MRHASLFLSVLLCCLFSLASTAPSLHAARAVSPPAQSAPSGWKVSWSRAGRLSNGSSTKFIGLFTVDATATAVTSAHVNACVARCSSTAKCGFVNLIKMTGSRQGNVVCMMFPKYFSSSGATYTTGPQSSGGKVNYSYGIRSTCTPTNGGALTCTPSAPVTSAVPAPPTTTSTTTSATSSTPVPSTTGLPLPRYNLQQANRMGTFYSNNNWDFWGPLPDPTHGTVAYTDQPTAQQMGLIGLNGNGQPFARVQTDDLPLNQSRASVRFQSKLSWDAALVVMDVARMPVGCATWPALWTVAGNTWPENGEIDILEGVGYTAVNTNANLVSVHMNQSSVLSTSSSGYSGSTMTSNQCMTNYGLGNTGCSFRDNNSRGPTWGSAFNNAGGGVWVALWGNKMGVRVWYWGRNSNSLPSELSNPNVSPAQLNPSSWGKPMANFQSSLIDEKLYAQNIVLDITLNGDWAGNVPMDGAQCGSDRSAALASGANYADAQFVLNGIDVYV